MEAERSTPNSRKLKRLGTTITDMVSEDDTRHSLNDWDLADLDGFSEDHQELMQIHFRQALARAQEVDDQEINAHLIDFAEQSFAQTSELLSAVEKDDGSPLIDEEISSLLRDIAEEISQTRDTMELTNDPNRKAKLHLKIIRAAKNGSIYIGRLLFFGLVFTIPPPTVIATSVGFLGSLASILGILEITGVVSVRELYEQLRSKFPALPSVPKAKEFEQK